MRACLDNEHWRGYATVGLSVPFAAGGSPEAGLCQHHASPKRLDSITLVFLRRFWAVVFKWPSDFLAVRGVPAGDPRGVPVGGPEAWAEKERLPLRRRPPLVVAVVAVAAAATPAVHRRIRAAAALAAPPL